MIFGKGYPVLYLMWPKLISMNRFFTLLFAAFCSTAVGQTTLISDLIEQIPEDEFGLVLSVLSQPEASEFLELVSDENLSLTFFLPTDQAIESWESQGEGVWADEGLGYLMSHLVAGTFYSTDLTNGQILESVDNVAMLVEITGAVYFNGGIVEMADLAVDNGVVHIMGSFNTPPSPEPITLTFQVDMTYQSVSAEGVYLAGTFQGWDPMTTPLNFVGDGIWEVSLIMPVGTYEFLFVNGNNWLGKEAFSSGDCLALNGCGEVVGHRLSTFTTETVYATCFGVCGSCDALFGCTNPMACNFNPSASIADGTCNFCHCGDGTTWDEVSQTCIVANPADTNFDGCVQLNDLLDLLSAYGDCGAEESTWLCGDLLEYQGYEYETVQIGEQCWFAENLRAEKYRNGDSISGNLSDDDWETTMEGARAGYNEDPALIVDYGYLYNLYTVVDERGLCPSGWHVPSSNEFDPLALTLGGYDVAGEALKSSAEDTPSWNGTNTSGYKGLPAGYRDMFGSFGMLGVDGHWWTSTPYSCGGRDKKVHTDYQFLNTHHGCLNHGNSIRCIKDTE